MNKYSLILASGSPRRKEIISKYGYEFIIEKAEGEEQTDETRPAEVVKVLSFKKAEEVAYKVLNGLVPSCKDMDINQGIHILGADTIVAVYDDNAGLDIILGKPRDRDEAACMIEMLAGRAHQVYTGVTLITVKGEETIIKSVAEKPDVYVKSMTKEEIDQYVATGECDDKAGSYAIQGIFGKYIDHFDGDFENVVGLPGQLVDNMIKESEKEMEESSSEKE